jgi:hypothetical protein
MLQALSGIAMIVNLALCGYAGVRLLARTESTATHPERWLAIHLLLFWCVSSSLSCALYTSWATPELALSEGAARITHMLYWTATIPGTMALFLFVQRTFYPESAGARLFVLVTGMLYVAAAAGVGVTEGFYMRVLNGSWYWLGWVVRGIAPAWLALEGLRWWRQLRRRVRLGLAEPMLVNRFLILGGWATLCFLITFAEPAARIAYYTTSGDTVTWNPEIGRPIVDLTVAATLLPQIALCTALGLAFFPPDRYRHWIEARAKRQRV